jgi:hypothetical protein
MTGMVVRVGLVAAALVALVVAATAIRRLGIADPNAWATLAAVLAVVAAVTSAWTSQRVVELQEDALEPSLSVVLDSRSRYLVTQLRVLNRGGSPAYDVRLTWDEPLYDDGGREPAFGVNGAIPVLAPSESASVSLGITHTFLAKVPDTTRRGRITYSNASGRRREKPVVVSAEHERSALVHDAEMPRTLYDIQKIPDALKRIAEEISRLNPPADSAGRQ